MRQPEAINRHQFNWWKEIALRALGEHLHSLASTVAKPIATTKREKATEPVLGEHLHSMPATVAKPIATTKRGKATSVSGHIRPRETAPIRTEVVTQLFED